MLCGALPPTLVAKAAQAESLVFVSTQLRPIGEAQKMRDMILKDSRERSTISPNAQSY